MQRLAATLTRVDIRTYAADMQADLHVHGAHDLWRLCSHLARPRLLITGHIRHPQMLCACMLDDSTRHTANFVAFKVGHGHAYSCTCDLYLAEIP